MKIMLSAESPNHASTLHESTKRLILLDDRWHQNEYRGCAKCMQLRFAINYDWRERENHLKSRRRLGQH